MSPSNTENTRGAFTARGRGRVGGRGRGRDGERVAPPTPVVRQGPTPSTLAEGLLQQRLREKVGEERRLLNKYRPIGPDAVRATYYGSGETEWEVGLPTLKWGEPHQWISLGKADDLLKEVTRRQDVERMIARAKTRLQKTITEGDLPSLSEEDMRILRMSNSAWETSQTATTCGETSASAETANAADLRAPALQEQTPPVGGGEGGDPNPVDPRPSRIPPPRVNPSRIGTK